MFDHGRYLNMKIMNSKCLEISIRWIDKSHSVAVRLNARNAQKVVLDFLSSGSKLIF